MSSRYCSVCTRVSSDKAYGVPFCMACLKAFKLGMIQAGKIMDEEINKEISK